MRRETTWGCSIRRRAGGKSGSVSSSSACSPPSCSSCRCVTFDCAEIDAFVPMVDAVVVPGDLITATMLYAQAAVFRSRGPDRSGRGLPLHGLLLIPHALTFPGAFAPSGLLGAGVNTTRGSSCSGRRRFPSPSFFTSRSSGRNSAAPPGTGRVGGGRRGGACSHRPGGGGHDADDTRAGPAPAVLFRSSRCDPLYDGGRV